MSTGFLAIRSRGCRFGRLAVVNDAQTWTVIGGFLAILAAMAGLVLRIVATEIRGVRGEINARFDAVDRRFDHLDRDVQALTRRVFGIGNE